MLLFRQHVNMVSDKATGSIGIVMGIANRYPKIEISKLSNYLDIYGTSVLWGRNLGVGQK